MIRLFVMDVDGTMTDGAVYLDDRGGEFKRFDVRDGLGISMLLRQGIGAAILSGRESAVTSRRAEELGISKVLQGIKDKMKALRQMSEEMSLDPSEIAYMGDDANDAECLEWAGMGFAPSDSRREALDAADVIVPSRGGYGAVRDAVEIILSGRVKEAAE